MNEWSSNLKKYWRSETFNDSSLISCAAIFLNVLLVPKLFYDIFVEAVSTSILVDDTGLKSLIDLAPGAIV